ncbi:uncharacterized protein BJ171DRAFT_513454 [Polychytrium aggregatum]|uniref:uncharacterized protein n=1 Tax=Polychytrium aggregatum TaxID=110093 RepID=UPI0022FE5CCE|nr:uncharacterized protein BJ171DRAFT_513454 [Polychytrium aggregatum]KAI9202572.1 hypothetical protein BJ171DRAFT_513454 [Polychytrium aggregatum]
MRSSPCLGLLRLVSVPNCFIYPGSSRHRLASTCRLQPSNLILHPHRFGRPFSPDLMSSIVLGLKTFVGGFAGAAVYCAGSFLYMDHYMLPQQSPPPGHSLASTDESIQHIQRHSLQCFTIKAKVASLKEHLRKPHDRPGYPDYITEELLRSFFTSPLYEFEQAVLYRALCWFGSTTPPAPPPGRRNLEAMLFESGRHIPPTNAILYRSPSEALAVWGLDGRIGGLNWFSTERDETDRDTLVFHYGTTCWWGPTQQGISPLEPGFWLSRLLVLHNRLLFDLAVRGMQRYQHQAFDGLLYTALH